MIPNPFHASLPAFIIYLIVTSAAILLGGNRAEYIALFNIFIMLGLLGVTWSNFKHIHRNIKLLSFPLLFLGGLFAKSYYQQYQYLNHTKNLNDIEITEYILQIGNFSPVEPIWGLKYWLGILCLSIIVYVAAQKKGFKRDFMRYFFGFSIVIALYGLWEFTLGNTYILWLPKDYYLDDLTTTFVNRNSYAIFCGCGILAGLYLTVSNFHSFSSAYTQHNKRIKLAMIIDYCLSPYVMNIICIFMLIAALILTHSRAGIILTIGFSILCYLLISKDRYLSNKLKVILFALFICALTAPIFLQSFLNRAIHINQDSDLRFDVYMVTLQMISDYPIFGTGLGSFEYVFQSYRNTNIDILFYWDKAHSTFLELCLELGIPLFSLMMLFYASLFFILIKYYLKYKSKFIALCICISGLIIFHSIIDFSLQIPAINILFHITLALGYAEVQKIR